MKMSRIDKLGLAAAKFLALISWAELSGDNALAEHYEELYQSVLVRLDEERAKRGFYVPTPIQLTLDEIEPDTDVEIPF